MRLMPATCFADMLTIMFRVYSAGAAMMRY